MAKIYTKKGDLGETSLFSGVRVSKSSDLIEVIGVLDECNAALGLSRSLCPFSDISSILEKIQQHFFVVGTHLMNAQEHLEGEEIDVSDVLMLEEWIDRFDAQLPQLQSFVLPGGSVFSAYLHFSRTVVRRLERRVVSLDFFIPLPLKQYINRLSDFLFVLARYVQLKEEQG